MDKYKIIIILSLIFSAAYSGCWGDDNVCRNDCYQGVNNFSAFSSNEPSTCHNTGTYNNILSIYHDFYLRNPCLLNSENLNDCNYGQTLVNVYKIKSTTSCSACFYSGDRTQSDNCRILDNWGTGCVDNTKICERGGFLWIECHNKANQGCFSLTSQADCTYGKHGEIGCYWQQKQYFDLQSSLAYESFKSCEYYADKCPEGYELNINNNNCVVPACYDNEYCSNTFGTGYICNNAGQWNAGCDPDPNHDFGFTVFQELDNDKTYSFYVRADYTGYPWLDIYDNDNLLYYGLNNDQRFVIEEKSYSSFFQIPDAKTGIETRSFSIYSSSLKNRLTYGIFPVCGNGVCEICESEDNCLSYPPESCLSCSTDCPQTTFSSLLAYNLKVQETGLSEAITYEKALIDPDYACKVRTLDSNSECNPLCVSHEFIDQMGCILNKYSNALPSDEFESKGLMPLREDFIPESCDSCVGECYSFEDLDEPICLNLDQDPCDRCMTNAQCSLSEISDSLIKVDCGIYEKEIDFKNKNYQVFFSTDNNKFYGVNNSLCSNNCECVSGNCNGPANDQHCCKPGYVWGYDDNKTEYCDNGRMKEIYRKTLSNYDEDGLIKSTISFNMDISGKINKEGGLQANEYICLDNPDVMISSALNKTSCQQGVDPFCAYGNPSTNDYSMIKPNGVGQCREKRLVTAKVFIENLTCVVHTHALAQSGCWGDRFLGICPDGWQNKPGYRNWFCVTDNIQECASAESLKKFLGGVGPILRTISYEQFCTTKEMVCSSKTKFTNTQDGGEITFTNCPQDSIYVDYFSYYWPVGFYCSLFGNDIDHIMGVAAGNKYIENEEGFVTIDMNLYTPTNTMTSGYDSYFFSYDSTNALLNMRSHHMPMIDRDADERLYHLLWNYESCVENFPGKVPSCEGVTFTYNSVLADDTGQPTHPFLGFYDPLPISSQNKKYVKSRAFCEELWEKRPSSSKFDWQDLDSNIYPAITVQGVTYSSDDVKNIIKNSCIYWYEPFLNDYYSNLPASELSKVIDITPPVYMWATNKVNFDQSIMDMHYCDRDSSGLVRPGYKCNYDYPNGLHGQDRNCNIPGFLE